MDEVEHAHALSIICSWGTFLTNAHAQTIICTQLFAGKLTNQNWENNKVNDKSNYWSKNSRCALVTCTRFPAFNSHCVYFLHVLIGCFDPLPFLWLVKMILVEFASSVVTWIVLFEVEIYLICILFWVGNWKPGKWYFLESKLCCRFSQVSRHERRLSQIDAINEMPLYPTEQVGFLVFPLLESLSLLLMNSFANLSG